MECCKEWRLTNQTRSWQSPLLCRMRNNAAHRNHFVRCLSVRVSVRLCVCAVVTLSYCHTYLWGDGQGNREVGDDGAGGGRRGGWRREKRGWEEGEGKKEGGREKRKKKCSHKARATPRREEEDKGREGERPPPCPPPHLCFAGDTCIPWSCIAW